MMLVKRALESRGYVLLEAFKGIAGVEMAESNDVDLILLDINLPDYGEAVEIDTVPTAFLDTPAHYGQIAHQSDFAISETGSCIYVGRTGFDIFALNLCGRN